MIKRHARLQRKKSKAFIKTASLERSGGTKRTRVVILMRKVHVVQRLLLVTRKVKAPSAVIRSRQEKRPKRTSLQQSQWRGGLSVTGGANTQTAAPPPPSPTHTHTNTHAAFLSEFLISLQGRIQDFGEEVPTWIIDALATGRGAREARVNFCSARSNFSTDCIGN